MLISTTNRNVGSPYYCKFVNKKFESTLTKNKDKNSWFCELLEKDKSYLIHHKNIQSLTIEIYKFLHNLSPSIMNNIFKVNQTVPYDLRKRNVFQRRNPSSVRYGTETISYIPPKIWTLVPETIKNCEV